MVKLRWRLRARVMALGFSILTMDVDMAVLRNPFVFFRTLSPPCDIAVYNDNPPELEGTAKWLKPPPRPVGVDRQANGGLLLLQNTMATRALVADMLNSPVPEAVFNDQLALTQLLTPYTWGSQGGRQGAISSHAAQCLQGGKLSARLLPPALFGSWRNFYQANISEWSLQVPVVIHYNWVVGLEEKQRLMMKHGDWLL
jgi:hypothetical protein